jgi:hypothetical protein
MSVTATTLEQADALAARLTERKDRWLHVSIPDRILYLQRCLADVKAVAPQWAAAACRAKGIDPVAMLAGEEWFVGPIATMAYLRSLMTALKANGQPPPVQQHLQNGQWVAQVFPDNMMDRLLWRGFKGEVWLQPGQPLTQGLVYRQKQPLAPWHWYWEQAMYRRSRRSMRFTSCLLKMPSSYSK